MSDWSHDDLQADLAASRVGNGEVILQKLSLGFWGGGGEMDVFSMKLSRTTPRPTCYEIKVSRADFMSDIRSEKYKRYEKWCERGYFAIPTGLVKRNEIPTGWGLMLRGDKGWYSVKQPRMGPLRSDMWRPLFLAVILKMFPGSWAEPTREMKQDTYLKHGLNRTWSQELGKEVQQIVQRNNEMKRIIEELEWANERLKDRQ